MDGVPSSFVVTLRLGGAEAPFHRVHERISARASVQDDARVELSAAGP